MSSDPPIDNADPRDEHNYRLMSGLRRLAKADWKDEFGHGPPSDLFIRELARTALKRIQTLEKFQAVARRRIDRLPPHRPYGTQMPD